MTTPAHCTRTDPHHPHPMGFESCPGVPFPGVEPPADVQATPTWADPPSTWCRQPMPASSLGSVCGLLRGHTGPHGDPIAARPHAQPPTAVQATPDPRLDVVAPGPYAIVRNRLRTHYGEVIVDCAVEILDALGAIPEHAPAPAGLTPQEIRRWIEFGADIATKAIHVTTMVEHGDDETPASGLAEVKPMSPEAGLEFRRMYQDEVVARKQAEDERDLAVAHDRQPYPTADAYERACAALEKHRARADLAEQRLGHIADALRDWQVDDDEPTNGSERFARAVRECLASTPDDTATAGTATGDE